MPNYCQNKLIVNEFGEGLRGWLDVNGLSFERIQPIPEPTLELCNEVWGTKCDLEDYVSKEAAEMLLELSLAYFDTASSPPIPVLDVLCRKFPGTSMTLYYFEPGNGFAGVTQFENGLSVDSFAEKDNEVQLIAASEFDWYPEDDPLELLDPTEPDEIPNKMSAEMQELRARSYAELKEYRAENSEGLLPAEDEDKFTCDDCRSAASCEFAYDWYNTNGDCLALK